MASHCPRSLFFPLAVLLLVTPAISDSQTEALITKICSQMEEFGFCSKTFHENLKSPSAGIKDLTQITIERSLINATNTHNYAAYLLHEAPEGPDKYALMACENAYAIAVRRFQEASDYFNSGDYQSVVDSERILPRALGSCTSYYVTPPYPPNPLADRNRMMRILIAMSLVTANYLLQAKWSLRRLHGGSRTFILSLDQPLGSSHSILFARRNTAILECDCVTIFRV